MTHGEVARECGGAAVGVGRIIGDCIRDCICKPRGLPYLSVIVVNKDVQYPDDGYYGMPELNGLDEQFQEQVWRGMVLRVFAYDWSHVEFDE